MSAALPSAVHEAKGSYAKNPQRRNDFEPKVALFDECGRPEPPAFFNARKVEMWRDILERAPYGVLGTADYYHLILFTDLVAELYEKEGHLANDRLTKFLQVAAKLGFSPSDRVNLQAPKKPKKNKLQGL